MLISSVNRIGINLRALWKDRARSAVVYVYIIKIQDACTAMYLSEVGISEWCKGAYQVLPRLTSFKSKTIYRTVLYLMYMHTLFAPFFPYYVLSRSRSLSLSLSLYLYLSALFLPS